MHIMQMVLGYTDDEVNHFFIEGLFKIGLDLTMEELIPIVMKVGEINLKCMDLLDRANTETYGNPEPVTVPLKVEKGPFIVVSGHDLRDLQTSFGQTKDMGINIYTHGEMPPAHAYPKLKKYPHLKGNFGTAWQNQQKEFDIIPAPVLFTTNCIMPPKPSYADRVFTTETVAFSRYSSYRRGQGFPSAHPKGAGAWRICRRYGIYWCQRRKTSDNRLRTPCNLVKCR